MSLDLRASELEHNFIKERLSNLEKHLSEICSKIAVYVRKLAYLRDSGDEFAKSIFNFSSKEILNHSLRLSLNQFSDILLAIQDYRDAHVNRLEAKVVFELSNYGPICTKAKQELKRSHEARTKELNKKNHLEKLRGKQPTNWQNIAQAEKEVKIASEEATRTACEVAKQIDHFENQKLNDIKQIFLEFIKIEMVFHAKALELYTKAYKTIDSIDIAEDLKEFRSYFRTDASLFEVEPKSIVKDEAHSSPSGKHFKPKKAVRSKFLTCTSHSGSEINYSNSSLDTNLEVSSGIGDQLS